MGRLSSLLLSSQQWGLKINHTKSMWILYSLKAKYETFHKAFLARLTLIVSLRPPLKATPSFLMMEMQGWGWTEAWSRLRVGQATTSPTSQRAAEARGETRSKLSACSTFFLTWQRWKMSCFLLSLSVRKERGRTCVWILLDPSYSSHHNNNNNNNHHHFQVISGVADLVCC